MLQLQSVVDSVPESVFTLLKVLVSRKRNLINTPEEFPSDRKSLLAALDKQIQEVKDGILMYPHADENIRWNFVRKILEYVDWKRCEVTFERISFRVTSADSASPPFETGPELSDLVSPNANTKEIMKTISSRVYGSMPAYCDKCMLAVYTNSKCMEYDSVRHTGMCWLLRDLFGAEIANILKEPNDEERLEEEEQLGEQKTVVEDLLESARAQTERRHGILSELCESIIDGQARREARLNDGDDDDEPFEPEAKEQDEEDASPQAIPAMLETLNSQRANFETLLKTKGPRPRPEQLQGSGQQDIFLQYKLATMVATVKKEARKKEEEYEDVITQLKAEHAKQISDYEKYCDGMMKLEAENTRLKMRLDQSQAQLRVYTAQVTELKDELRQSEQRAKEAADEARRLHKEQLKMKSSVKAAGKSSSSLSGVSQSTMDRSSWVKKEAEAVRELREEKESLFGEVGTLRRDLDEMRSECISLKDKLQAAIMKAIDELNALVEERMISARKSIAELQSEYLKRKADLDASLADKEQELKQLMDKIRRIAVDDTPAVPKQRATLLVNVTDRKGDAIKTKSYMKPASKTLPQEDAAAFFYQYNEKVRMVAKEHAHACWAIIVRAMKRFLMFKRVEAFMNERDDEAGDDSPRPDASRMTAYARRFRKGNERLWKEWKLRADSSRALKIYYYKRIFVPATLNLVNLMNQGQHVTVCSSLVEGSESRGQALRKRAEHMWLRLAKYGIVDASRLGARPLGIYIAHERDVADLLSLIQDMFARRLKGESTPTSRPTTAEHEETRVSDYAVHDATGRDDVNGETADVVDALERRRLDSASGSRSGFKYALTKAQERRLKSVAPSFPARFSSLHDGEQEKILSRIVLFIVTGDFRYISGMPSHAMSAKQKQSSSADNAVARAMTGLEQRNDSRVKGERQNQARKVAEQQLDAYIRTVLDAQGNRTASPPPPPPPAVQDPVPPPKRVPLAYSDAISARSLSSAEGMGAAGLEMQSKSKHVVSLPRLPRVVPEDTAGYEDDDGGIASVSSRYIPSAADSLDYGSSQGRRSSVQPASSVSRFRRPPLQKSSSARERSTRTDDSIDLGRWNTGSAGEADNVFDLGSSSAKAGGPRGAKRKPRGTKKSRSAVQFQFSLPGSKF